MTLAGCSPSTTADTSGSSGDPVAGGNLISGQDEYPTCLDLVQEAAAQNATRQIVDNLTDLNLDTGAIEPWLATSWDIENDGRRFVFHLRDDVTFSNGQVFDASNVKANFDSIIEYGKLGKAGRGLSYLLDYENSEVIDATTVAVNFTEPRAGFLEATSEKELGFLSPDTLSATPEDRCRGNLIGTGPFTIKSTVPEQEIVLAGRTDYNWASPNARHEGAPYLDTITFRLIKEEGVRVGSLISGDVDTIVEVPQNGISRIEASGGSIVSRPVAGVPRGLVPNLNNPILADVAVRQALQVGIDRQDIAETFFTEYDKPATSILTTTVPGYVDLGSELEYNPEKAKKLLAAAGWAPGSDGIRTKDGNRLTLDIKFIDESYQPIYELVQQQLKSVGIDITLSLITGAQQTSDRKAGNFDLSQTSNTRPDPDILLSNLSSKYSSLWSQYPQPELDSLLDQQSKEVDNDKRSALVERIQRLAIEQGYLVPYWGYAEVLAVGSNVHGVWQSVPSAPVYYDTWKS